MKDTRILALGASLVLALASLGSAAAADIIENSSGEGSLPAAWSPIPILDQTRLPAYSDGLDKISSCLAGAALLLPGLLVLEAGKESLPMAGLAYSGSLALAWLAKEGLKSALPRPRPYVDGGLALSGELLAEAGESFPSGHATLAFCAATSFAVLSSRLCPDSKARPWLVAGGYVLAAGASLLRVQAGAHFPTDVLAGALLGSAIGGLGALVVPLGRTR